MNNFVINTSEISTSNPINEQGGCYLYFFLEEGQIQYKLECRAGRENDMAILLASLHTFEVYSAAVDGVALLSNGDDILERHDIVLEAIDADVDEDFEDSFDEADLSPLVHPLNVYNGSQDNE